MGNIQVSGSGLTLGLTGSSASTFSRNILDGSGGAGGLPLSQGSLILSGSGNTFSGGTTVKTGATLTASVLDALGTGGLTLSGGTLTTTTNVDIASLTLGSDAVSYLDFGAANSVE